MRIRIYLKVLRLIFIITAWLTILPYMILTNNMLSLNIMSKPMISDSIPSFVITVPNYDRRVPIITELFRKYADIELRPFYGINGNQVFKSIKNHTLTPGEIGLRETMKMFYNMTLGKNLSEILVFEDDAIPHYNFSHLFRTMSNSCREADILLLGSTYFGGQTRLSSQSSCFDADRHTFGGFGLYVRRNVFQPILKWLNHGRITPYDDMYVDLQRQGFIVRVAYPEFLVIADISHASLTKNNYSRTYFQFSHRAEVHQWNLSNYPMFAVKLFSDATEISTKKP